MKIFFVVLVGSFFSNGVYSQLSNDEIMIRKTGRYYPDTSYVYLLPYEQGHKYLFVQGANSNMSHHGELSFDFKMKTGTRICAARDGIVVEIKSNSNRGGLNELYLNEGNHIIIRHKDGSVAKYWHLQFNGLFVHLNDTVRAGQVIGLLGSTGYSAFPHLHFQVLSANGRQILPRFMTSKGIRYLRPGRFYRMRT